jgi:hypothetical protein
MSRTLMAAMPSTTTTIADPVRCSTPMANDVNVAAVRISQLSPARLRISW